MLLSIVYMRLIFFIHGAPGSPKISSAYSGSALVPNTGVVSQRYARAIEHEGIIIERVCSLFETLPSGNCVQKRR